MVEIATPDVSMSTPIATNFEIGSVLKRGLAIAWRKAAPFGLVTLVIMSPTYLLAISADAPGSGSGSHLNATDLAEIAVEAMLMSIAAAILGHATIRELRVGHSSIGESIRWCYRLIWPVLGITILATVATWMGFMLLIVPGLILLTVWWVVIPVAVVEGTGVMESFGRSSRLTDGNRWRVFGILCIVYGAYFGLEAVIETIFSNDQFALADSTGHPLVSYVSAVAVTVVDSVLAAVGYHDLRIIKDGGEPERIAVVFD